MALKRKALSLHWEFMFARPMYQTPDMQAQHDILEEAGRLLENGTLRHTMKEHYGALDAANLRRAHAAIESGRMIGKLVLSGVPAG